VFSLAVDDLVSAFVPRAVARDELEARLRGEYRSDEPPVVATGASLDERREQWFREMSRRHGEQSRQAFGL
jgi:hypothetical protein